MAKVNSMLNFITLDFTFVTQHYTVFDSFRGQDIRIIRILIDRSLPSASGSCTEGIRSAGFY